MNLIAAVRAGDIEKIKILLATENIDPVEKQNKAVREAVSKGDLNIVNCFLENKAVLHNITIKDNDILHRAVAIGDLQIVNRLLEIDAVLKNAAAKKNLAFQYAETFTKENPQCYQPIMDRLLQIAIVAEQALLKATHSQDIEKINYILQSANIDPRNNYSFCLRYAARLGYSEIVRLLLSNEIIRQQATANNNDALREAQMRANGGAENFARYQPIVAMLMTIPAVATLAYEQANQVVPLAERAQFSENAMQSFTTSQLAILDILKKHYQERYQVLTVNWFTTLSQIKLYLELQYLTHPAQDASGDFLPLSSSGNERYYYSHLMHSAWRYVNLIHEAEMHACTKYINEGDKEIINYLWLALNDDSLSLPSDIMEQNKTIFCEGLAQLARAHNWDQQINGVYYDDAEDDKPTCEWGVGQRLLEQPYQHPYLVYPELRTLQADILNDRLSDWITEAPFCFLQYIDGLDKRLQEKIYRCVESIVIFGERPNADLLSDATNALRLPEEGIQFLIERAKQWFGIARMTSPQIIHYNDFFGSHTGYLALIRYLASQPIDAFTRVIFNHLSSSFSYSSSSYTPALLAQQDVVMREATPSFDQTLTKLPNATLE